MRRFLGAMLMIFFAVAAWMGGCSSSSGEIDDLDAGEDVADDPDVEQDSGPSCEIDYELPDGESFALDTHTINEPENVVQLAESFLGDIPPVLLFVDGLSDGVDDQVELVGGAGERTGYGYDEVPDTEDDVYAMYYGSIHPQTCDFGARLDGEVVDGRLWAESESLDLDLTGLSSLTDGVSLRLTDVSIDGEFDEGIGGLEDVIMSGFIADDGLDELIEAVQDQISVSREQAMNLLGPDEDGRVPVELVMDGHRVVVDGFTEPDDERQIEGRELPGDCCPEDLDIGDSVQPYLRWAQQGLDDRQAALFDEALPAFRDDPKVAMVATARRDDAGDIRYEVYSGGALAEGMITFERRAGEDDDAPTFEVVEHSGADPLANVDGTKFSDYHGFLEAGENPEATAYESRGYAVDDPRVGFVEPDEMHYPFAMERIAQNFDDPRVGDLMIIPVSWSTGGFSTHGNLSAPQSRTPLVMAGPGVQGPDAADETDEAKRVEALGGSGQSLVVDDVVRQVDIAPTVAAALGVDETTGVGPDMRLRDDVRLRWQDGRVLDEVFTDEALASIDDGDPVADRAVIIVNDGLTNPELLYQVFSDDDDYDVESYRRLFDGGWVYEHGAIATFPSNSYSSHNTLGAGVWSGRHGVVDNSFWAREQAAEAALRGAVFETEYLFGSAHESLPVETLFEAVTRTFGGIDDGVLGASINTPSTRGAEFATFERRRPGDGFQLPDAADAVEVGGETYALPAVDAEDHTEVMDNSTTHNFASLYQDHLERGDDGFPIPKVSIINLGSTDTAGHGHGPHGDELRYDVIARTNQRMEVILDVLEWLEIDESTLLVLTADHGMELQDQSRSSSRGRALTEAGISYRSSGWHYYFKELAVQIEGLDEDDGEVTVSVRVVDRATKPASQPVGVEAVEVDVVDADVSSPATTDQGGYAEIVATPEDDGGLELVVDHPDWNEHRQWVEF